MSGGSHQFAPAVSVERRLVRVDRRFERRVDMQVDPVLAIFLPENRLRQRKQVVQLINPLPSPRLSRLWQWRQTWRYRIRARPPVFAV